MADGDLKKGTVKWFSVDKGFGFITPDDGSEDLFVHQTAIKSEGFRTLGDGEAVEYVVEQGNDGRAKASNVTGPGGASVQGSTRGGPRGVGGGGYNSRGGGYDGGSRGGGYDGGSRGGGYDGGSRGGGYDGGSRGSGCFKCGESGHMARDCSQGGGGGGGGGRYGGGGGGGRYGGGGGGGGGGGCYTCGEDGHFARDCTTSNR